MKKHHILVVDDEDVGYAAIEISLGTRKYKISRAESVQEAWDFLHENSSPDLIILDVLMPKKMGLELLDRMAESEIKIPVIVVSGADIVQTARAALKKGAADFLPKPITAHEISEAVEMVLKKGGEN